MSEFIRFASVEVNFRLRELRVKGRRVRLEQKPFRILELLLREPGMLVGREELAAELWPHLPITSEHSLNTAVNTLRRALGDSPRESRYIETLSGRGYRFIGHIDNRKDGERDCLMGRYFLDKVVTESIQRAIGCFQSALQQDAECPSALTGLVQAYAKLALTGTVAPAEFAARAVDLLARCRESSIAVRLAQVDVHVVFESDLAAAEAACLAALRMDRESAVAHSARATLFTLRHEHAAAVASAQRAHSLQPVSLPILLDLARTQYYARDFDGAMAACWQLLSLEPAFAPAQALLGLVYYWMEMPEEAAVELENACICSNRHPAALAAWACVQAATGKSSGARDALAEIDSAAYTSSYRRAVVQACLGDAELARESLRRAERERDPLALWQRADPFLERAHL